ncbi:MAG TPA: NAD(+)/NADH kinase [Terriglobales bacterium]|jgi:NAD+ kinase|nr:NAD(+)/NADH kinase [Terriglobales bacterium]
MSMSTPSSTRKKTVAIVSKPDRPELGEALPALEVWLQQRNYAVVVDEESAAYFSANDVMPRADMAQRSPDIALVLGGDGTLLSAVRAVAKVGTLILGVNLGTLGFMTELTLSGLYPALEAIENENYVIDNRSMLSGSLFRAGHTLATHAALNEVVISKSAIARLNHFEVFVDAEFVSSYRADALIIATPTGSTAYSLGAGGPILNPDVNAFVITPVSPHGLTHRPVVVRDTVEIEIHVNTGNEEAYLSFDGQVGMPARDGDIVRCVKSEHQARLLRFQKTFFEVLATKLNWGER